MPRDVLDRLLRPWRLGPVTSHYPDEPPIVAGAGRGLPELDASRCDGTAACIGACPTGAIALDGPTWSLNLGSCIFCGDCARACPRGAIRLGGRVELAVDDVADLRIERRWRVES